MRRYDGGVVNKRLCNRFEVIKHFSAPTRTSACQWFSLPVEGGLLPAVEGVLELLHQVGLPRQPEETLLLQALLPDEVHALLHQHGGQLVAIAPLVTHRLLQLLAEDACNTRHTHSRISNTC